MNKKILVIDDEASILKSYRDILAPPISAFDEVGSDNENGKGSGQSFDVSYAEQGEAGFELAKTALEKGEPFSVAMIDMRMPPGWDGLETARALRKLDSRIYIVIVTAYADKTANDLQEALQYDVLLLRKPFVSEEILQLANNLCNSWNRDLELDQRTSEVIQASKLAVIGELATGMAHEINSPLNVITLSTHEVIEILEDGPEGEYYSDLPDILNRMTANSDRIDRIIKHLLRFGRKDEQAFREVQLSQVISNILLICGKQLANRQIRFNNQLPENLPPIYGDPNQVEQIFLNLVNNAADSLEGRKEGEITIEAKHLIETEMVEIRLSDNGSGMTEETRSQIFQPFYTTKEEGKGTGLGLSILVHIIDSHLGKIECVSEVDKGTSFVITLPTELGVISD